MYQMGVKIFDVSNGCKKNLDSNGSQNILGVEWEYKWV